MNNAELQESLKQALLEYESRYPGNGLVMIGTSRNDRGETEISVITNYLDGDSMLTLLIQCIGQIPDEMLSPEMNDFVKLFDLKKYDNRTEK